LIFLPHFPLGKSKTDRARVTIFDRLARLEPARSKVLLWAIVIITPVMGWWSLRVQFDDDLMHLNYLSPRMKAAEAEVSKASAYALSSMFVIGSGSDEDEALQHLEGVSARIDSMQKAGMIRSVSNPTLLVPSSAEQKRRVERWVTFWNAERVERVVSTVREAARAEGFAPNAFAAFEAALATRPEPFDDLRSQV
jgi:predicted exporter